MRNNLFSFLSACKSASEKDVCLRRLLHLFATSLINISVEANSMYSNQTANFRSTLIRVYNVKHLNRRQKQANK